MAIRTRKGKKISFLVYWRNPFTQKIESKSFDCKQEAEKHNALIQYRLRYERESFRPTDTPIVEEVVVNTLESVFYQYLRDRKLTPENLYNTLKATQAMIEKYGDLEIENVDISALQGMQQICIEAGNKGTSIRRKIGIIKATLGWAARHGLLAQLPVYPEIPKCETTRYIPPTPEEISRIYEASPVHLRRVVILGFMLGIRVGPSELMRIKWSDVNFDTGYVRVQNAKKGNTDPWRDVHIKETLLPLFKRWHDEDCAKGMEYIVHYNGKPIRSVKRSWKKTLEKIGFTRHIRPYDLRHGFATEAIAAGGDYGSVGAIMGHKDLVTVLKHYQHVTNPHKATIIENMPQPNLDMTCMTKTV